MSDSRDNPGDFKPGNPHAFKKGQSGNPGGRPKGYERRLRECVEAMRADDPMPDPEGAVGEDGRPVKVPAFEAIVKRAVIDAVAGDRYARDFVADRLMGRAKQTVEVASADEPDDEADLAGLTLEELRVLAKVRASRAVTPSDVH